jgi:hypothetical protein
MKKAPEPETIGGGENAKTATSPKQTPKTDEAPVFTPYVAPPDCDGCGNAGFGDHE